jgi:hypothetical protein
MGGGVVPTRIIAYGNVSGILSAHAATFAGMGSVQPLFARVVCFRCRLRADNAWLMATFFFAHQRFIVAPAIRRAIYARIFD